MRDAITALAIVIVLAACDGDAYDLPAHEEVLELDPMPEADAGVDEDASPTCLDGSCETPGAVAILDTTIVAPVGPDPEIELPLPTCDDVDARLRADFGIVIQPGTLRFGGLPSADIGCEDRIKVYRMFVAPFAFEGYRLRLDPDRPVTMHLYRSADPRAGFCSGYVPSANAIQIRDLRQCLRSVTDAEDRRFRSVAMFLIHEMGHVIANRNDGIKAQFRDAELPAADPDCYDRGFLKTYYYRSGVNPVSESFAESLALFVWNRKSGAHATIEDFAAECPSTHDFARTHVFEHGR